MSRLPYYTLCMAIRKTQDQLLTDVDAGFNNSPGIRGAPQSGLVCDMVRIKARASAGTWAPAASRPLRVQKLQPGVTLGYLSCEKALKKRRPIPPQTASDVGQ